MDAELELKGRLEAYVAKRIQWEENRHVKAGKEPFHLQFIGTLNVQNPYYRRIPCRSKGVLHLDTGSMYIISNQPLTML